MRSHRDIVEGWQRGVSGSDIREDRIVHVEHIWGTVVSISMTGTAGREDAALAVIKRCRALMTDVDLRFSTFKPDSEVSLFRSGRGTPTSAEFEQVMAACLRVRATTQGAFDPWAVGGGYDPSAYVKGWAAGQVGALMRSAGFDDHIVNAGGDICANGDEQPGSGEGWASGIVNPHAAAEIIEVVALHDEAMATSGRYERGDHIIDPATGHPALAVDSATVVGPDPGVADALATAALVRGPGSMDWFARLGTEWSLHLVAGPTVLTHGPAFASV